MLLCVILVVGSGAFLLRNLDNSPVFEIISNIFPMEESKTKTIKVNYLPGQEEKEFYYEEYINNFWWRGRLLPETSAMARELEQNVVVELQTE